MDAQPEVEVEDVVLWDIHYVRLKVITVNQVIQPLQGHDFKRSQMTPSCSSLSKNYRQPEMEVEDMVPWNSHFVRLKRSISGDKVSQPLRGRGSLSQRTPQGDKEKMAYVIHLTSEDAAVKKGQVAIFEYLPHGHDCDGDQCTSRGVKWPDEAITSHVAAKTWIFGSQ